MAGIGFELKKLFRRRGLFSMLRAYGYAGIVCTGPMLLGGALLLGMALLAQRAGSPRQERELLNCMITYTLLASLLVTSILSMVVTRFTADMLFEEREEAVMPSFWGSSGLQLCAGGLLYGVFLLFSGASLVQGLLCFWLYAEMTVNWNAMSYLTAIKEYRGILFSFVAALLFALGLGWLLLRLNAPVVEGLLLAVTAGYGLMLVWDVRLLCSYFSQSEDSPLRFLCWLDRYPQLAGIGLFTSLGLFGHLLIMWAGPLSVQVKGLFRGAPYYDVPALLAFLSILGTTVNFVVSVEVNFYPKYRDYYSLFNDGGVAGDITEAEEELLAVLNRELRYTALKQVFVTAAVISLETLLLGLLPLGFNDLMHGYFRILCVGYGLYAVGNVLMLILLYFADYRGAVTATAVFAVCAGVFTALSLLLKTSYYGFGFAAGAACFYLAGLLRLGAFTDNLPYRVLGRQPVTMQEQTGWFTRLAKLLDRRMGSF